MKAILEFNLGNPEERAAHLKCVKAEEMANFIWELIHNSKKGLEYKIEAGEFEDQYALLEAIYERLWDNLKDRELVGVIE